MRIRPRELTVAVMVVLWVAGVYAAYYAVHKPFAAETFSLVAQEWERLFQPWSIPAIADSALNLGAALWIGSVAYGLGRFPLRMLHRLEGLERFVLSTSLGLGVISLATFALGLMGLLYNWVFYLLLTAASLVVVMDRLAPHLKTKDTTSQTLGDLLRIGLSLRLAAASLWGKMPDRASLALAIFVALTEVLALLAALAPPWAWDSLVYHLKGPELYIRQHGIVGGIDGMHFYFPPLVEMLFLVGMLIKGPIVANLIHWLFGLLAAGAVFCCARRFLSLQMAWLSATIFVSVPSIAILSSKAYVDLALILYLTLAFSCTTEGFRSDERKWLLLGASFLGFAMGVKYTSIIGVLALGGVFVAMLAAGRGDGMKRRIAGGRLLAGCCVVAGALAAPWYLKNLAFTGNPFYPFVFGGRSWDFFQAEWVTRAGSGLIQEPWRLLVAPLEMTVLGIEGGEGYQATIGPLVLALLPLLALGKKGEKGKRGKGEEEADEGGKARSRHLARADFVGLALIFCGVGYLLWLAGVAESALLRQTRLLFPVFGLLSVLAAYAVCSLKPVGVVNLRLIAGGAIGVALTLATVSHLFLSLVDSPLPFIVGAESQDRFLARHLGPYYEVVEFANGRLEEDAKVFFLWEPRTYYFQRQAQPDTLLNNWRHLLFLYGDGDAVAAALRGEGYTHILINIGGMRYFMEEPHREVEQADLDALVSFERRHLRLTYGDRVEAAFSGAPGEAASTGAYSLSRLE